MIADTKSMRRVEQVKASYNANAQKYFRRESKAFWMNPPLSSLIPAIRASAATAVIDIGCGSGALIQALSRELPDLEYCGIDISEKLIELAGQRLGASRTTFHVADLHTVDDPFKFLTLEHSRIFIICVGTLAYYGPTDPFTSRLIALRSRAETVGMGLTFHNAHFLPLLMRRNSKKRYWRLDQIVKFSNPGELQEIKYSSFLPLNILATKFALNGIFLSRLDRLFTLMFGKGPLGRLLATLQLMSYLRAASQSQSSDLTPAATVSSPPSAQAPPALL